MHATIGSSDKPRLTVAIGSDHAGFKLKKEINDLLAGLHVQYTDFGTDSSEPVDYPDIAVRVARAVSQGKVDRGILICGSGIGVAVVANKIQGIRAALCTSVALAEMSRQHNNANILTLGARITRPEKAKKIVNRFLNTDFESGGRHERRVKKIHDLTGI